MICTIQKMTDRCYLFYPICEVFFLNNCSEFKGILHITTFFVTTFFVVAAKIRIFSETQKNSAEILLMHDEDEAATGLASELCGEAIDVGDSPGAIRGVGKVLDLVGWLDKAEV